MSDMSGTRAVWAKEVPDLYGDLDQAQHYLTIQQVSEQTGLAVTTIFDALSRPQITKESNPLCHLSRPAARVGNRPLWSAEQVAKTRQARELAGDRFLGGGTERLDTILPEDSNKLGYLSTVEIAELVPNPRTGRPYHEQTVRRWAREHGDFPKAVALRSRESGHPGVPLVVYDGNQVRAWLTKEGIPFTGAGEDLVVKRPLGTYRKE